MTKTVWTIVVFLGSAVAAQAQSADPLWPPKMATSMIETVKTAPAKGLPLPVDLGGHFELIDQHGFARTEVDPTGNLQLLFFGYASCREICSAALPQMADVEQILATRGVALTPVMITIDRTRDTVATIGPALAKFSPNFIGLTGDDAALQAAYKVFSIENSLVYDDPFYGPVYAHGSFLYLLDSRGVLLTVVPPILSTERVVDLIANYAPAGKARVAVSP